MKVALRQIAQRRLNPRTRKILCFWIKTQDSLWTASSSTRLSYALRDPGRGRRLRCNLRSLEASGIGKETDICQLSSEAVVHARGLRSLGVRMGQPSVTEEDVSAFEAKLFKFPLLLSFFPPFPSSLESISAVRRSILKPCPLKGRTLRIP